MTIFRVIISLWGIAMTIIFTPVQVLSAECDQEFTSSPNGHKGGVFEAPVIHNPQKLALHCTIKFVAREGERVRIAFRNFDLRASQPECNHEYLDMYTEIKNPNRMNILESPFGGRYCGSIPPRLRVSLHRVAVIIFHTDFNHTSPDQFYGYYKFIPGSKYEVGTSRTDEDCGHIIHSDMTKNGVFLSPTYPGIYPKNIECYWKFVGKGNQRVRLEFRDFDLFYGGAHCPFDNIKIYDGPDHMHPLIGTYCGQQRNLVVFSSTESLMVTFTTLNRMADSQNRGFQSIFNFSESYLSLEFIRKNEAKNNAAEHIRGSECDQRILSRGRSHGTVFSPSYPFPYFPKVVCRYFIYGLEDSQNLERVRLQFSERFDIPAIPDTNSNCSDGFLRLYLQGQETRRKYDSPDYELCGKALPSTVTSIGPRLLMVFSSGSSQGIGFKANYRFETEYQIPGTAAPDGKCHFTYLGNSAKSGKFNSPRHPGNYPSNTTCDYRFKPNKDELVQLIFNQFKVRNDMDNQTSGNQCTADYLEIYNVYKNEEGKAEILEINGRYCGRAIPGPIENERDALGLHVYLKTDEEGVYSGFEADYLFKKKQPFFRDCGSNITNQEWGEILSPNWPEKYGNPTSVESFTCDWFIYVRPSHKVLLWSPYFSVEGDPKERGCPAAVLRVWPSQNSTPIELCGEGLAANHGQILSKSNMIRLAFTVASKAVGAKGFKIIWTEILDGPKCDEFLCKRNNFCISKDLLCNGYQNCGLGDLSDEERCAKATEVNVLMLVGMTVGITCGLTLILCVWCHRKRFRGRDSKALPHHPHTCERGARFAAMESSSRNISPVLGARKEMHHLSCGSLRSETNV